MTMRLAGHVGRMGDIRNAYKTIVRLLEGKRPLEKSRRGWGDGTKRNRV